MTRYFFDHLVNGRYQEDDTGEELSTLEQVRSEAMRVLPSIAKDEVHRGPDQQTYTVLVKDAEGQPVYTATLTYAGLWFGSGRPKD
jgi:hypothetical protein